MFCFVYVLTFVKRGGTNDIYFISRGLTRTAAYRREARQRLDKSRAVWKGEAKPKYVLYDLQCSMKTFCIFFA